MKFGLNILFLLLISWMPDVLHGEVPPEPRVIHAAPDVPIQLLDIEPQLSELSAGDKAKFYEKRGHHLENFARLFYRLRSPMKFTIRFGRIVTLKPIWSQAKLDDPDTIFLKSLTSAVNKLDQELTYSSSLVANSSHDGLQIGLGGHLGAAVWKWGTASGLWLNFFLERPKAGRSHRIRMNVDYEALNWVVPGILTGGLGVKVMYFVADEYLGKQRGISEYTMSLLPDFQITDHALSIGYKGGLYLPTPYVINMHKDLRRSASLVFTPGDWVEAICIKLFGSLK